MSETQEATTAPETQAQTPAATPEAAPAPWHASYDAEARGWIENKGFHNKKADEALADVIKMARSAESKFGVTPDRLVKLPLDMDNKEELMPIFDRLGRPSDAKDYGLSAPEDTDDATKGFVNALIDTFHQNGLTKAQAAAVYAAVDRETQAIFDTQEATTSEERAAALADLEAEWGATFAENKLIAQAAVQKLGATEEEINALEAALGSNADVIKLFQRIGAKAFTEADFVAADRGGSASGATTPEAARARKAELMTDPEWRSKFNKGNLSQVNELSRLNKIIAKGLTPAA